jgi:adenosylcobinamide kinase/adenosylcobinamide-phosphate guanylyltransferase
MKKIILLTGGGRSGKSRYALDLATPYRHKAFIATAEAFDDEMKIRITKHKKERDPDFFTLEEPVDLAGAIRKLPETIEVAVIDCLTIWLCNLMCKIEGEHDTYEPIEAFLKLLHDPPCDLIMVTNEVGMGIIPIDKMTRRYRDLAGTLNQRIAVVANQVILMVSGLPLILKDKQDESA